MATDVSATSLGAAEKHETSECNAPEAAGNRFEGEEGESDRDVYILVDEVEVCARILSQILDSPGATGGGAGVEVAIDFEGEELCREGELCLVQIAKRGGPVILLDIVVMGQPAFDEGRLKELLECPHVRKIGFDGRADADALFHLHGCEINNFYDVQVAFGVWKDNKDKRWDPYVKGLKRAFSSSKRISEETKTAMTALQDEGRKLFAPELGGSYDAWRRRPMDPRLMRYAAADVQFLHIMKDEWGGAISDADMAFIAGERIREAIHGDFASKGKSKALKDF